MIDRDIIDQINFEMKKDKARDKFGFSALVVIAFITIAVIMLSGCKNAEATQLRIWENVAGAYSIDTESIEMHEDGELNVVIKKKYSILDPKEVKKMSKAAGYSDSMEQKIENIGYVEEHRQYKLLGDVYILYRTIWLKAYDRAGKLLFSKTNDTRNIKWIYAEGNNGLIYAYCKDSIALKNTEVEIIRRTEME